MAATDTRQLQLQVSASAELLVRNLRQADNAVATFQRSTASRLDAIDARFERLGEVRTLVADTGRNLVGALGIGSVAGAGTLFLSLADDAKQMQAQLRLATAEFGTFGQGQADVERIASETRIGLQATTALYGTLVRAAQPLGRTQADAALASETFAKALKVGGASAEAASSATLQFSQALASGVLRGDEFNSIAEASPRVLKLLADSMGLPQGQLRGLAAEGKLTASILYDALTNTKVTGGLDREFKQLPVTMGESMQLVRDAAVKVAGAFDRGSELSSAVASFIGDGTDGFADLTKSAERFGIDTRAVFAGLGNVFDPILISGTTTFDALGVRIFSVRDQIASLLDSIDTASNFDTRIENSVKRVANRVITRAGGGQQFQEKALSNLGGNFRSGARLSAAESRREASARRLEGLGYVVPRNADGSVDEANIRRAPAAARPTLRTAPPAASKGGRKASGSGRARAAASVQTFTLGTPDFGDYFDPAEAAALAKRFGERFNDEFKAVFGSADPLSGLLDQFEADQAKRLGPTAEQTVQEAVGPIAEYRAKLHAATDDMNAALQGVAVNGFDALEYSMLGVIDGTESIGSAFSNMARSIIADLARIVIQKAILSALPGVGTFLNFSKGGKVEGKATGGRISGPGTGTSDSILALIDGRKPLMVSNGESIVTAEATARYWPFIDAMNRGRLPKLATGGAIGNIGRVSRLRPPSIPRPAGASAAPSRELVYVRVDKSDLFDVHVQRVAAPLADQAAARGAAGGAQMARQEATFDQEWALR